MRRATVGDFLAYWESEGEGYFGEGDYDWMASWCRTRILEIGCGVVRHSGSRRKRVDRFGHRFPGGMRRERPQETWRPGLGRISGRRRRSAGRRHLGRHAQAFRPETVVCWLMGAPAETTGRAPQRCGSGRGRLPGEDTSGRCGTGGLTGQRACLASSSIVAAIPGKPRDIGSRYPFLYHLGKTLSELPFAVKDNALYRKLEETWSICPDSSLPPVVEKRGTGRWLRRSRCARLRKEARCWRSSAAVARPRSPTWTCPIGKWCVPLRRALGRDCGRPDRRPASLFLPRHGYGHTISSPVVNYRANIWALRENGASRIISVASVGGIRGDLSPGTSWCPIRSSIYTWVARQPSSTAGTPVTHVDFTDPTTPTCGTGSRMRAAMVGGRSRMERVCSHPGPCLKPPRSIGWSVTELTWWG